MPRKNRQIPHQPYRPPLNKGAKRRYPNKRSALEAAEAAMLLRPVIELFVYQDIDGGWYLTSQKPSV